jgi:hypothetical protein
MSENQPSGRNAEQLAAELKRLREASAAGVLSFKAIEARIAELEEQIAKYRQESGIVRPLRSNDPSAPPSR